MAQMKESPVHTGTHDLRYSSESSLIPFRERWKPNVSVVIPAFNDAESLAHILPRIPRWVHEVILVDSNSTDNTVQVAQELWPSVRVVQQSGRGKSAALRTGFAEVTGDIIVMLDADGSTDPAEIPFFAAALVAGADLVKGSRFVQGGKSAEMLPFVRLGNWVFGHLTNALFGTRYTDITYGYTAMWHRHADILSADNDGWASVIVGNIRAAQNGLRVVEVASVEQKPRTGHPAVRMIPHQDREKPSVSVVIPALNEAENLAHVLPRIPRWVHEVILVDGNSTDNTIEVAQELWPSVRVVQQRGRGKGAALRTGFAEVTGDIIVMLDADGSTDPAEIPFFAAALVAGADFVKGSRFVQGGGTADMPFYRRLGNWGFVFAVRVLFGGRFSDLCYGYNAFWARVVPHLNLDGDGFEIETMMNVRALRAGFKVVEVASFEAERVFGIGRLRTIPDGWRVLKTIVRERFRRSGSRPQPRSTDIDPIEEVYALSVASEAREA